MVPVWLQRLSLEPGLLAVRNADGKGQAKRARARPGQRRVIDISKLVLPKLY